MQGLECRQVACFDRKMDKSPWLTANFLDLKHSHSNELLDISSTIQEGVSAIADVSGYTDNWSESSLP